MLTHRKGIVDALAEVANLLDTAKAELDRDCYDDSEPARASLEEARDALAVAQDLIGDAPSGAELSICDEVVAVFPDSRDADALADRLRAVGVVGVRVRC